MLSASRTTYIRIRSTPPREPTLNPSTRILQTPLPSTQTVDPDSRIRRKRPSGFAMPFGDRRIRYTATDTKYTGPACRC